MRRRKLRMLSIIMVLCLVFLTACGSSSGENELEQRADNVEQKVEDSTEGGAEPLQDVNQIPKNGIITKEQFETVAGQDRKIQFVGESDEGISYTWTYDASQIQNPQDQNLKIDFNQEDLDDIKEQANNANDALEMTMHGKGLICPPTLSLVLSEAWQSDTVMLLKEQDDKLAKMSDVTIASEPESASDDSKKDKEKEDKKKENKEEDDAEDEDDADEDTASLTDPLPGKSTLSMTITSLEGKCYIVGGITDKKKLASINNQLKAAANANKNGDASSENGGSGGSGGSGDSGSDSGNGNNPGDIAGDESGSGSSGGGGGSDGGSGDVENGGGSDSGSGSSDYTCTISISCATILDNMGNLTSGKEEFVPSDGWILAATTVSFSKGDSVHDVLKKVCKDNGIHMESAYTPAYDSAYVEGINQLYEFDCGELSGWMYNVNGWFPNYGCSKYTVSDGDQINWVYTCDLGKDVGDNSMY